MRLIVIEFSAKVFYGYRLLWLLHAWLDCRYVLDRLFLMTFSIFSLCPTWNSQFWSPPSILQRPSPPPTILQNYISRNVPKMLYSRFERHFYLPPSISVSLERAIDAQKSCLLSRESRNKSAIFDKHTQLFPVLGHGRWLPHFFIIFGVDGAKIALIGRRFLYLHM